LSFSRNGFNFGVAFQSDDLKKGELVAACSLFASGDTVTINMNVQED